MAGQYDEWIAREPGADEPRAEPEPDRLVCTDCGAQEGEGFAVIPTARLVCCPACFAWRAARRYEFDPRSRKALEQAEAAMTQEAVLVRR